MSSASRSLRFANGAEQPTFVACDFSHERSEYTVYLYVFHVGQFILIFAYFAKALLHVLLVRRYIQTATKTWTYGSERSSQDCPYPSQARFFVFIRGAG